VKLALCTLTLAIQVGYVNNVPQTVTVTPRGCPAVHVVLRAVHPGRLRVCPLLRQRREQR
jgi:hypothetical protein